MTGDPGLYVDSTVVTEPDALPWVTESWGAREALLRRSPLQERRKGPDAALPLATPDGLRPGVGGIFQSKWIRPTERLSPAEVRESEMHFLYFGL